MKTTLKFILFHKGDTRVAFLQAISLDKTIRQLNDYYKNADINESIYT